MQFSSSSLDFSVIPYEEGVRPAVTKPNPEFLADIGEKGMRELFVRFYTCLHESPIKELFPQEWDEMLEAADNSADFFIQICGGPDYFSQKKGAPQMGKRHAPFAITPESRLHWLACFKEALQLIVTEKQSSEAHIQSFWNYLNIFSIWMINARH
jgi:hemoglobin